MLKKISILGCGWLGLPLAKTLVKLGHQVKGSTTTAGKLPILAEDGIQPFLLDLNELLSGAGQQDFFRSEILVINVPPKRKSGNNYRQQMINLAEHLRHTEIRKVLLVSSTSVYAPSEAVITEESALDENGAADLIAVENLFRNEKNWQTTIVRMAGLFGPDRQPGRFLAGKTSLPAPEAPVNLIHLSDCTAILSEIIKQEKWNEIYNACSDEHPSRRVFYTAAAQKLQLPPPVFEPEKEGKTPEKLIGNTKLKEELQYEFKVPDPMKAIE